MKVLYDTILKGRFVDRPNRFVVHIELDGEVVTAHLPNPGRMWELLFPGIIMYAVPHSKPDAKTQFRVVGIERDGQVIMLDTNYSNDVAQHLIENRLIPGWEQCRVVRREYTVKVHGTSSRFDLLLTNDYDEEFLLEVKSCTLFSRTGAMFPDAITERGRKHLLHLKELQDEGYHTGVLFLVQWDWAQWFLPDYHTDLAFAQTFKEVAPHLDWKAVAVAWDDTFAMPTVARECTYPGEVLESEAHDSGVYVMVMHLDRDLELEIGSKGMMHFKEGYYMYVGSAKANLAKRIERHKRKRKKMHWHLDYFRGHCEMIAGLPIRTSGKPQAMTLGAQTQRECEFANDDSPVRESTAMGTIDVSVIDRGIIKGTTMGEPEIDVECALADAVRAIAEWNVPNFGCSDCECSSHLFGMSENPIHNKAFMEVIEEFRMNHLDAMIKNR
ncbi:DNA/RNA nuclease SfsA [Veillonella denticariosi JCM 15641]|uniref:DNA/RNA nuclease SfsA n=1 Tax=Veillonella denticariosi JCM 15641 TaxID=1298594 RepID=A0A2S7ZAW1_9FIRM|nr:DNA/RNA nuclease SfsA [Veillonella denticariosi]PQL20350.1 DNA/RNA nuclease SfsA [Veillonella denticariosi JCM 15641]